MKKMFLLAGSMILLSHLIAQSPDSLYYSLLFDDDYFSGQPSIGLRELGNLGDGAAVVITHPVKENHSDHWKPVILTSGLMMISGFCDGTSEVLKIKYHRFKNVFPDAPDQFWDYNISWKNKYKDGLPPEPAFWGSKTALVWTTDGYHLMRAMRNVTMITAMVIPLHNIKHKNWKSYVSEGVMYYFSYTLGFNLAYDVVFK